MSGNAVATLVKLEDDSLDAEAAVLSALLTGDSSALNAIEVSSLSPDDFVDSRNAVIYQAITVLAKASVKVDPITVAEQLKRSGDLLGAGGKDYIGTLIDAVPFTANILDHANIVRHYAEHRLGEAQRTKIHVELRAIADSALRHEIPLTIIAQNLSGLIAGEMSNVAVDESLAKAPQLDSSALYGIIGEWVALIAPHTEASDAAILVTAICSLGTLIGRGPFMTIDGSRHGLNNFALLVGPTSSGRKGTAVGRVRHLLTMLDPQFNSRNVKAGLSSGQGIIHHVRDGRPGVSEDDAQDAGVTDKRLLVIEAEIASALRQMRKDGNTLSPVIREAWDGNSLGTLTKGDPLRATDPHIGIVGQITSEELHRQLDNTEFFSGFLNRFLIVWTERKQLLPFGGQPDADEEARLIARLSAAVISARSIADVSSFTIDGATWWRDHYEQLTTGSIGRVGAATQRAAPHVRRIALLFAVLDGAGSIDGKHLAAAHAVWRYAEDSARYVFGASELSSRARRLEAQLLAAGRGGLDRTAIRNGTFGSNNVPARDIDAVLGELEQFGRAQKVPANAGLGRPREVWVHARQLSVGAMGVMGGNGEGRND
jgi:hypothetical protein